MFNALVEYSRNYPSARDAQLQPIKCARESRGEVDVLDSRAFCM